MAVYERSYRPYEGAATPDWSRFLILPRYAYQQASRSRFFIAYLVLCLVPSLVAAVLIYLHHNLSALALLDLNASMLLPINARFFLGLLSAQGSLAFLLALFTGPALIAPDLANNGLALYLSRPFSRWEYILGKFCVLAILMSLIMWLPSILLFLFQSYLEGGRWLLDNLSIAGAITLASSSWIVLVCLMSMAASAWVKRKPMAAALVLGFFFVAKAMGSAINGLYRTSWGDLIDVGKLSKTVWADLFGITRGPATAFQEAVGASEVPLWSAWAALIVFSGFCLWLLTRKVRAYHVVR